MQKKSLIIILLTAVCFMMTDGCANNKLIKKDGASSGQDVSFVKGQNSGNNAAAQGSSQATSDRNAGYKGSGSQNAKMTSLNQKVRSHLQDVHFAFDSSVIEPQYRDILKKNADYLMANSQVKVTIEGHCDERGTLEYNMALGQRRADEVKKYLTNLGVYDKSMTTVSYGKEKPLDPEHNEEAWAKNRRAHFAVN